MSKNRNEYMKTKKSQLHRLLIIYTVFLLLLLAGMAHGCTEAARGFNDGAQMAANMNRSWVLGEHCYKYMLMDIPVRTPLESDSLSQAADSACRVEVLTDKVNLMVEKPTDSNPIFMAFRSIGDSGYIYTGVLLLPLARLAIFILMGIIFISLCRSVRKELPLNRRNILYTRLIGFIILVSELLEDLMSWSMRSDAARLLADSSLTVDTSFPVSYWNLLMGVLMLFMAEVFAIGTRLSEEQKLTI